MESSSRYEQETDRPPVSEQSDVPDVPSAAAVSQEIDVERLIWDPDYRSWAKVRMEETG